MKLYVIIQILLETVFLFKYIKSSTYIQAVQQSSFPTDALVYSRNGEYLGISIREMH